MQISVPQTALSTSSQVEQEWADRSNEALFAFAEASTDAFWMADAATGRLEYLSPAFEHLFGAARDKAMAAGGRWVKLMHPEDREIARDFLRGLRAGETSVIRYRIVRPDGRLVHVRESGFPIRDPDGTIRRVGGIVTDVSDDQRAAAERDDLRAVIETIPQMVWRSCAEGRWTWASPQWLDYTGQTQEESHGWGWLDVIHPEDRAGTMTAWHAARPRGELDAEYRVRRAADGAWRWHRTRSLPLRGAPTLAEPEGQILEWMGTTSDIEELKRLQGEQLKITEELQRHAHDLVETARSVVRRGGSSSTRDATDARLAALGRAEALTAGTVPPSVPLRQLVNAELDATGRAFADRVTVEGPPAIVPIKGSGPFVLALHELAANAARHGALALPDGHLAVTWRFESSGRFVFYWTERGVPLPLGPPARGGYGTEAISRALPYASGAETRLEFTPDGVHCEIALRHGMARPLEAAAASPLEQ